MPVDPKEKKCQCLGTCSGRSGMVVLYSKKKKRKSMFAPLFFESGVTVLCLTCVYFLSIIGLIIWQASKLK